MYYVYILQSLKDRRYYIGSTHDVDARLRFHNAGLQRSTKFRIPFRLVYSEAIATKEQALAREKQIQSYKGGEGFKQLKAGVLPRRGGAHVWGAWGRPAQCGIIPTTNYRG